MRSPGEVDFLVAFDDVSDAIHQNAVDHGWWDSERSVGEIIALMHSELSECLEAFRKDNPRDEHCPDFSSAEVELADLFIRGMDFARKWRMDLPGAILAKHEYNKTREYRHGKKF